MPAFLWIVRGLACDLLRDFHQLTLRCFSDPSQVVCTLFEGSLCQVRMTLAFLPILPSIWFQQHGASPIS
jgi:hypothetical protein